MISHILPKNYLVINQLKKLIILVIPVRSLFISYFLLENTNSQPQTKSIDNNNSLSFKHNTAFFTKNSNMDFKDIMKLVITPDNYLLDESLNNENNQNLNNVVKTGNSSQLKHQNNETKTSTSTSNPSHQKHEIEKLKPKFNESMNNHANIEHKVEKKIVPKKIVAPPTPKKVAKPVPAKKPVKKVEEKKEESKQDLLNDIMDEFDV